MSAAILNLEEKEMNASKWRESYLLVDKDEELKVTSAEKFIELLGCNSCSFVKVVSIFGNTGEGKSHTMNYTFFNGNEIFLTSRAPDSCTIGIWVAYDPILKVIAVDTEGLLGVSKNSNQRTRLLLKLLAISDIIIYRTRAARLHSDLFTFLGDASKAYVQHFSLELKEAVKRCKLDCTLTELGPAVVIFHETLHTEILTYENDEPPEAQIRKRFQEMQLSIEAFSALEYVGTRTATPPTSFKALRTVLKKHLQNSTVRSARQPEVIFNALKHLNEKFSGEIEQMPNTFPDQYFTCRERCLSCNATCILSMNHDKDGTAHKCNTKCKFNHQLNNKVYYCRNCHDRGEEVLVVPKVGPSNESSWVSIVKYPLSGYTLECINCGIIYRSRQYWYGNRDPEETAVTTQIVHYWPGESNLTNGTQNTARRIIDGVSSISETVTNISAKPTKYVSDLLADSIAPSYWLPNSRITQCGICHNEFTESDTKHHCRACGGGFCDNCSSGKRPVPEKGWTYPVRVCNNCYEIKNENSEQSEGSENTPRRVGEVLHTTLGTVATGLARYPKEWIKDNAKPDYWIPDKDIKNCKVCQEKFDGLKLRIHHCRDCGHGVCENCSKDRKPVPFRGWDHPVRVCNHCSVRLAL